MRTPLVANSVVCQIQAFITQPSRLRISELHLTSLVFSFLIVLPIFPGHLLLLTSYRFLALALFLILALSVLLPQLFGISSLIQAVYLTHLTLSNSILKHAFSKRLLTFHSGKLQYLQFTSCFSLVALYKWFY